MNPRFLLDTHVVIRWLSDSRRLSREQLSILRRAVRQGEPVAVSAITLIEIALICANKRSRIAVPPQAFFEELQDNPAFRIMPITFEIAAEVASLGRDLSDPADRTIVATARVNRLRLITSDQRIIESKLVSVLE